MHLEHIGVTFHRNEKGELDLRAFGGASKKRTAYVADITGQAILHVLYEQLMRFTRASTATRSGSATSLVLDADGHCAGAVARDIRTGVMEIFDAKSVILACGGNGSATSRRRTRSSAPVTGSRRHTGSARRSWTWRWSSTNPTTPRRERPSSSPRAPVARARTS